MLKTTLDIIRAVEHKALEIYWQTKYAMRPVLEYKTREHMQRQVWRAIRDFYAGETDVFGFIDDMVAIIDAQYEKAWREGARDMNVDPQAFEDEDYRALHERIMQEREFILGLAEDIQTAQANHYGVEAFRRRAEMWANRYDEVVSAARAHFGGKQKLEWVLGETEKHCRDGENHGQGYGCWELAGTVATAKKWERAHAQGIYPKSPMLACQGFSCDCELKPTKKRFTKGGIPHLV